MGDDGDEHGDVGDDGDDDDGVGDIGSITMLINIKIIINIINITITITINTIKITCFKTIITLINTNINKSMTTPAGDLDSMNSQIVMSLLLELQQSEGITLVMVTHDLNLRHLADRVVWGLSGAKCN